jgi:DNA (cytosine-5)-methyltransferase 1
MRMLQPRELARAQGFGEDYILTGTKSSQVARIGNSVCPPVAEALVRANITTIQAAA